MGASAIIPTPDLPLTAEIVADIRTDVGCPAAGAIEQNLAIPPDRKIATDKHNTYFGAARNNASNFSEATLAVWANADNDPEIITLDSSGEDLVINGDMVSRSHLKISGNRSAYLGATEYGTRAQKNEPAFDMSGADNCFNLEPDQVPRNPAGGAPNVVTPPAPAGFPLKGQFDPDGDGNILEHFDRIDNPGIADDPELAAGVPLTEYFSCPFTVGTPFSSPLKCSGGELTVEQQGVPFPKGLYFVQGKVNLNASDIGEANITIVTNSQLKVTGSVAGVGGPTAGGCAAETTGETLTLFDPYLGDLLFGSQYFIGAANTKDAEDAITVEGSKSCFKGIIVATNGRTQLAGEQNSFTCPVMGDRVRLNGSKLYISNECLQAPDIQINKTPDGEVTVNAGENATFTITVTNNGGPANNVDVDDVLPGTGWSIITKTFSGNPLPQGADDCLISGGNTLHCDIAVFGTQQTLTVVVRRATTAADCSGAPGGKGTIDNGFTNGGDAKVEVGDVVVDEDPGHIFVQCPDAKVEKTPDNGTVNAGQTATFTIRVTALGPGTSFNVKLDDPPLPNGPPFLPDSGFTWQLGGTNAAACTLTGASGSQILHCEFGDIPFQGFREITLSTPTDVTDCAKGKITNPVKISGDGDTNATNNTDEGSLTVICGAIRILKNSTKTDTRVKKEGAIFNVKGAGLVAAGIDVTDDTTAAAPDEDADIGEVCVDGLQPGATYSVTETQAPPGYGGDGSTKTVVAVAGECPTGAFNAATFENPPLFDIQVNFRDGGSGETNVTTPPGKIDCDNAVGADTPDAVPAATWHTSVTHNGLKVDPGPTETIICTIVVDP